MDRYINNNFFGSVDDLLNHCTHLDVDKIEQQVKAEEKEECIRVIMKELECNEFEAGVIYNEIALVEVKETVDKMVADGLLYMSGHTEDGEPLFSLTELGKAVRDKMNKDK
jgi:hypothetical protein